MSSVSDELAQRLPGLERLWSITKGDPSVRIAVLDGPADTAAVAGLQLEASGGLEHGTLVHSIISGSSDAVLPGLAPNCTVLSIPIFETRQGKQVCSQSDLARGIRQAVAERAAVINVSASQQADLLALSSDLSGALQQALGEDILVVAAAGNQGCACDTIPASVAGVLAVGAHGEDGDPLVLSNWGPNQRTQGLMAPGDNIPGSCVGGGLCCATGTSFAAATVSGIAGLLMSVDVARGIAPSGSRIRKILLGSCSPPSHDQVEIASSHLSGRLNVSRATDLVLGSSASARGRNTGEELLTARTKPDIDDAPIGAPQLAAAGTGARDDASVQMAAEEGALVPADCGCGGGNGAPCTCKEGPKQTQLVYAIGRLGVSFINQARRDSIWRIVNGKAEGDLKPITDAALQELFKKQPFQAQSVVWTLSRSEVPMYAVVPAGAYAAETYKWLVEEWSDTAVEFVSIPGVLAGQATLYDGNLVDVVVPDLRGMFSWETKRYVKALKEARKKVEAGVSDAKIDREINRFLGKIYFSIRNRGLLPEERALNAAATNAFNFSPVIIEAGEDGLTLKDIAVERSPLNRPGSEYFDVLLTFFDPNDRLGRAPLRARFTIDVSDTVPVMIGDPVLWNEY